MIKLIDYSEWSSSNFSSDPQQERGGLKIYHICASESEIEAQSQTTPLSDSRVLTRPAKTSRRVGRSEASVSPGPVSRVRVLLLVGPFEAWGGGEEGLGVRGGGRRACANLPKEKKRHGPLIADRRGDNGWTRRGARCGAGDWPGYAAGC